MPTKSGHQLLVERASRVAELKRWKWGRVAISSPDCFAAGASYFSSIRLDEVVDPDSLFGGSLAALQPLRGIFLSQGHT